MRMMTMIEASLYFTELSFFNYGHIKKLEFSEIKTKKLVTGLKKLPTKGTKSTLLVLPKKDENITLSARNLPKFKTILADSLNVYDILKYKYLVIDKDGVKKVIETFKK